MGEWEKLERSFFALQDSVNDRLEEIKQLKDIIRQYYILHHLIQKLYINESMYPIIKFDENYLKIIEDIIKEDDYEI